MSANDNTVNPAVQLLTWEKLKNFGFSRLHRMVGVFAVPFLTAVLCLAAGCVAPDATPVSVNDTAPEPVITLREGDSLRITFPGSTTLDSVQPIRRDGKIVLPVFGELYVAGLTPVELEQTILTRFADQLVRKEVHVTLESSTFAVYVNGAVLRPGKVESNRPLTALEAIMETGGFDYARANLRAVKVIRTEGSEVKNYQLDFKNVLEGRPTKPFYLKPSDIIFVPEKFTLF